MNKYKLRKTQQFGNFKYDPGKYYVDDKKEQPIDANDESSLTDKQNETNDKRSIFDDELEAPWNQYAWAEELRLRVSMKFHNKRAVGRDCTMCLTCICHAM